MNDQLRDYGVDVIARFTTNPDVLRVSQALPWIVPAAEKALFLCIFLAFKMGIPAEEAAQHCAQSLFRFYEQVLTDFLVNADIKETQ